MKKILFAVLLFFYGMSTAQTINPNYDRKLADSLGGDERGMKMYTFVILKTGTANTTNKAHVDSAFNGHFANMSHLVKENKLVVAGPFEKNENFYRGLFILNVKNKEEARLILQTDPAVKAKLLEPELFEWYGSAALMQSPQIHDKLSKYK